MLRNKLYILKMDYFNFDNINQEINTIGNTIDNTQENIHQQFIVEDYVNDAYVNFKNHVYNNIKYEAPFTSLYNDIQPFIMKRSIDEFPQFSSVFVVNKNHEQYQKLISFLNKICTGISTENIVFDINNKFDLSKINKNKYYIIDLRKDKDTNIGSIQFNNIEYNFVLHTYCIDILNNCKGIFCFADNIEDIPQVYYARNIFGLCDLDNKKLHEFIYRCNSSKIFKTTNPLKQDNRLYGILNGEMWAKYIVF